MFGSQGVVLMGIFYFTCIFSLSNSFFMTCFSFYSQFHLLASVSGNDSASLYHTIPPDSPVCWASGMNKRGFLYHSFESGMLHLKYSAFCRSYLMNELPCKVIIKNQLVTTKPIIYHIFCSALSLVICFPRPQLG